MTTVDEDGVPLPDPDLMKKWREAALRDLPPPGDLADLIACLRWGAELDRIGAANKDMPDGLTSIEHMLRMVIAYLLTIPVLLEGGKLAPLMRLQAAIVDLAAGRQSDLFVPVVKKPGTPGKGVAHAAAQGLAARALTELVASGEPLKQAADRVAKALRKGRKDMRGVDGTTVKNWRARLNVRKAARGAPDDALKHYLAPVDTLGSTPKERGENLLKVLRERVGVLG